MKEIMQGGSMAITELHTDHLGNKFVTKRVPNDIPSHLGSDKLEKQHQWLSEFNKIVDGHLVPRVSDFYRTNKDAFYIMEYIPGKTLKELMLGEDFDTKLIDESIKVLEKVFKSKQPIVNLDANYIKTKHLDKMIERTECFEKYTFYNSDEIYINGERYTNLKKIIGAIKNNDHIMDMLTPKYLVNSHGDFTFQNLIANSGQVKVIDPRGEGMDSIYYDVSKLFQSVHGKYDLIHKGNFRSTFYFEQIHYDILDNRHRFDKYFELLKKSINNNIADSLGPNWETITLFYEGSHFISMAPFRMKESVESAVLCYAIGIEILNQFLEAVKNGRM